MTSVLASSTTGTVPAVEVVARVHAVLDGVGDTDVGEVSGRDVAEVERGIARMEALKLRMVASAHRQGAAGRSGMSGTPAWLAAHTRAWGGKAAADVMLATALHDSLPLTRRALAAGALSTAHASVIAETTRRLPAFLSDGERVDIESALVARARHVDPGRLRRSAKRALEAAQRSVQEVLEHEDGELRAEEGRAAGRVRLTMHDNLDGTVTGHFTVPTLAGAILRKTIQQMVSPRRRRGAGEHPRRRRGAGEPRGAPWCGSPRGCARTGPASRVRRSSSCSSTCRPTGSTARSQPPSSSRSSTSSCAMRSAPPASTPATTSRRPRRDVSPARPASCPPCSTAPRSPSTWAAPDAFFTEAQRVALATTYDECAAQGCDRPYAWCDLHHADPWSRGGATDLALAVPVCGFHHRLAHDPRHEHEVHTGADGRKAVTFRRRGG